MAGQPPDEDRAIRNQLRWRSRRGLLELELLLQPFVAAQLDELEPELVSSFAELLACDDLDIHEWLLGRSPPAASLGAIVDRIREFHASR